MINLIYTENIYNITDYGYADNLLSFLYQYINKDFFFYEALLEIVHYQHIIAIIILNDYSTSMSFTDSVQWWSKVCICLLFFLYPSLTLRVMVSATFCVIPSLTDLWAAFWSFSVLSMASFNSRLRYADLALASSASTKAWSASGVYGPRGSGWPVSMQGQQCMTCSPKETASF